jgi:MFS family permease
MSAIYSLGAIVVLPLVPFLTDKTGRRGGIMIGSLVMLLGGALQAASQNSTSRLYVIHDGG